MNSKEAKAVALDESSKEYFYYKKQWLCSKEFDKVAIQLMIKISIDGANKDQESHKGRSNAMKSLN